MRPALSRTAVGAVLLAAGQAARIGRRPKSLLLLDGLPLIQHQLRALAGAGVQPTVIVLGHHAAQIAPVVQQGQAMLVHNPQPDDGLVSSQRLGLQTLPGQLDAVIVALADQPLVDTADISALLQAWWQRPSGVQVVYPEVNGLRGNPVIFSQLVREQILASSADIGCRQWQQLHPDRVHAFLTDNPHYLIDIDTEDDRRRFEDHTGRPLCWPTD